MAQGNTRAPWVAAVVTGLACTFGLCLFTYFSFAKPRRRRKEDGQPDGDQAGEDKRPNALGVVSSDDEFDWEDMVTPPHLRVAPKATPNPTKQDPRAKPQPGATPQGPRKRSSSEEYKQWKREVSDELSGSNEGTGVFRMFKPLNFLKAASSPSHTDFNPVSDGGSTSVGLKMKQPEPTNEKAASDEVVEGVHVIDAEDGGWIAIDKDSNEHGLAFEVTSNDSFATATSATTRNAPNAETETAPKNNTEANEAPDHDKEHEEAEENPNATHDPSNPEAGTRALEEEEEEAQENYTKKEEKSENQKTSHTEPAESEAVDDSGEGSTPEPKHDIEPKESISTVITVESITGREDENTQPTDQEHSLDNETAQRKQQGPEETQQEGAPDTQEGELNTTENTTEQNAATGPPETPGGPDNNNAQHNIAAQTSETQEENAETEFQTDHNEDDPEDEDFNHGETCPYTPQTEGNDSDEDTSPRGPINRVTPNEDSPDSGLTLDLSGIPFDPESISSCETPRQHRPQSHAAIGDGGQEEWAVAERRASLTTDEEQRWNEEFDDYELEEGEIPERDHNTHNQFDIGGLPLHAAEEPVIDDLPPPDMHLCDSLQDLSPIDSQTYLAWAHPARTANAFATTERDFAEAEHKLTARLREVFDAQEPEPEVHEARETGRGCAETLEEITPADSDAPEHEPETPNSPPSETNGTAPTIIHADIATCGPNAREHDEIARDSHERECRVLYDGPPCELQALLMGHIVELIHRARLGMPLSSVDPNSQLLRELDALPHHVTLDFLTRTYHSGGFCRGDTEHQNEDWNPFPHGFSDDEFEVELAGAWSKTTGTHARDRYNSAAHHEFSNGTFGYDDTKPHCGPYGPSFNESFQDHGNSCYIPSYYNSHADPYAAEAQPAGDPWRGGESAPPRDAETRRARTAGDWTAGLQQDPYQSLAERLNFAVWDAEDTHGGWEVESAGARSPDLDPYAMDLDEPEQHVEPPACGGVEQGCHPPAFSQYDRDETSHYFTAPNRLGPPARQAEHRFVGDDGAEYVISVSASQHRAGATRLAGGTQPEAPFEGPRFSDDHCPWRSDQWSRRSSFSSAQLGSSPPSVSSFSRPEGGSSSSSYDEFVHTVTTSVTENISHVLKSMGNSFNERLEGIHQAVTESQRAAASELQAKIDGFISSVNERQRLPQYPATAPNAFYRFMTLLIETPSNELETKFDLALKLLATYDGGSVSTQTGANSSSSSGGDTSHSTTENATEEGTSEAPSLTEEVAEPDAEQLGDPGRIDKATQTDDIEPEEAPAPAVPIRINRATQTEDELVPPTPEAAEEELAASMPQRVDKGTQTEDEELAAAIPGAQSEPKERVECATQTYDELEDEDSDECISAPAEPEPTGISTSQIPPQDEPDPTPPPPPEPPEEPPDPQSLPSEPEDAPPETPAPPKKHTRTVGFNPKLQFHEPIVSPDLSDFEILVPGPGGRSVDTDPSDEESDNEGGWAEVLGRRERSTDLKYPRDTKSKEAPEDATHKPNAPTYTPGLSITRTLAEISANSKSKAARGESYSTKAKASRDKLTIKVVDSTSVARKEPAHTRNAWKQREEAALRETEAEKAEEAVATKSPETTVGPWGTGDHYREEPNDHGDTGRTERDEGPEDAPHPGGESCSAHATAPASRGSRSSSPSRVSTPAFRSPRLSASAHASPRAAQAPAQQHNAAESAAESSAIKHAAQPAEPEPPGGPITRSKGPKPNPRSRGSKNFAKKRIPKHKPCRKPEAPKEPETAEPQEVTDSIGGSDDLQLARPERNCAEQVAERCEPAARPEARPEAAPAPASPQLEGAHPERAATAEATVPHYNRPIKVDVRTFGCPHTRSDSDYMIGVLKINGFEICLINPDVLIVNSCTITAPTEPMILNTIRDAELCRLPVIFTATVPCGERESMVLNEFSVEKAEGYDIDRIVDVVGMALERRGIILVDKRGLPEVVLPKVPNDTLTEVVPISKGCMGACTLSRPVGARIFVPSYTPRQILDHIWSAARHRKIKEIFLTAEQADSYGTDIGTNYAEMLTYVSKRLPPQVIVRLGFDTPPTEREQLDVIIDVIKGPNFYEFIHLPIQSGSDRMLELMGVKHNVESFFDQLSYVKARLPDVSVATNFVSGFPLETDDDHQRSVIALRTFQPEFVNITKYCPPVSADGATPERLPLDLYNERTRELAHLYSSYSNNARFLDKTVKVWITASAGGHLVGRTKQFLRVNIKAFEDERALGGYWVRPTFKDGQHQPGHWMHAPRPPRGRRQPPPPRVDLRTLEQRYLGTVQEVVIIRASKWSMDGVIIPRHLR